MSDDGDKKSDATMRFLKKKDVATEDKLAKRSDIRIRNERQRGIAPTASMVKVRKNCGCNRVCGCQRPCGCIHYCVARSNPYSNFYFSSPRAPCSSSYFLSDFSSALLGNSCSANVTCQGGRWVGDDSWNAYSEDSVSPCGNLNNTGDQHVAYSYKGSSSSPYINSYEHAQNRKKLLHYINDSIYF